MEIVIEYILEKHQLKPVSSNMKKLKQREAKGFTQNDGRVNTQHSSVEKFLLGCFFKKIILEAIDWEEYWKGQKKAGKGHNQQTV